MRSVLHVLREEVEAGGGALQAYVFVEDCVGFVAEGPAKDLAGALGRARSRAEESFQASDRKPLWGEERVEEVTALDRDHVLAPLRRLPAAAGLASDLSDYPWAGGDWLFPPD